MTLGPNGTNNTSAEQHQRELWAKVSTSSISHVPTAATAQPTIVNYNPNEEPVQGYPISPSAAGRKRYTMPKSANFYSPPLGDSPSVGYGAIQHVKQYRFMVKQRRSRLQQQLVRHNSVVTKSSLSTFHIIQHDGTEFPAKHFRDMTILVVNIATNAPDATERLRFLQRLHDQFGPQGFAVWAFPTNDFGNELASDEEIQQLAREVYGFTFPIFPKTSVQGRYRHPVFEWLTYRDKEGTDTPVGEDYTGFVVANGSRDVKRLSSRKLFDWMKVQKHILTRLPSRMELTEIQQRTERRMAREQRRRERQEKDDRDGKKQKKGKRRVRRHHPRTALAPSDIADII